MNRLGLVLSDDRCRLGDRRAVVPRVIRGRVPGAVADHAPGTLMGYQPTDAQRAAYWKQRALSAEGHLVVDAMGAGARAVHSRTHMNGVPFDHAQQEHRDRCSSVATAVVLAVNAERMRRRPKDHPGYVPGGG